MEYHQQPHGILKAAWTNMMHRCYNSSSGNYSYYGAKGITVCKEWKECSNSFIVWSFENGWKKGLILDRIDNEGNYSPENCRWVTRKTSNRNRSNKSTNFREKTRICSKCGIEKPLTDFHIDRKNTLNRKYVCKLCRKKK